MIIRLKENFKEVHGGYWKAADVRDNIINKNKNSEFLNEITKRIFEIDDINLMKQLLEDEVFYEKILIGDVAKLHNKIKLNKLTAEEFINEYNITGDFGFVSVCQMLGISKKINGGYTNDNGYLKAKELRIEKINKNKYSEFINETTKQMFAVDDINKLKQLLEDEVFYEKIQDWVLKRFYKNIQLGELTAENFINGYNKMGHHGFVGVCKILSIF